MIDLERRLIEFGDQLDRQVDPVSLTELTDLLDDSAGAAPIGEKRHSSWRVAAVAAALVFVIVGGFALLTRWGAVDSDQVGSEDKIPSGPAEPIPGEWVLSPGGEVFESSLIGGVAFGEQGLVAVGVEKLVIDQAGEPTPTLAGVPFVDPGEETAVWTSEDGSRWQRVPHEPEVFGVNGRLGDVVAATTGYVVVGETDGVPGMWTSPDTVIWTRVQAPPEAALLARLMSNDQVIVTQGSVAGRDINDRGIWVSQDGENWTHLPEVAWSNPPIMAAGPSFVILGEAREWIDRDQATYTCEPVVWTSSDGLDWDSDRPLGELFTGGCDVLADMTVTWFNDSLFAVARGSVWVSTDAVTWELVSGSLDTFAGVTVVEGEALSSSEVTDLVSGGDRLVAVGRIRGGEGERGAIWTSTDGAVWNQVPNSATLFEIESRVSEVVATSNGFVAMNAFTGQAWIWLEAGT